MIITALVLLYGEPLSSKGSQHDTVVMPKVAESSRCAGPDDPASRRLESLRFTRDDYIVALHVAIALRRAGLDPLPHLMLCYNPAGERRDIEPSAPARRILHRHRLTAAQYVDRMWSLMLALTDPDILQTSTDAIRANRDLTADPEIKRLLNTLSPD